jgi:hypothetical protein
MKFTISIAILATAILSLYGFQPYADDQVGAIHAKSSYSAVARLLAAKCVSCHNATRHPEKVDLSSYSALMNSGEHGPIVVAGHPEKSKILLYVDGTRSPRMPFRQAPLSEAAIGILKTWIKAGAKK